MHAAAPQSMCSKAADSVSAWHLNVLPQGLCTERICCISTSWVQGMASPRLLCHCLQHLCWMLPLEHPDQSLHHPRVLSTLLPTSARGGPQVQALCSTVPHQQIRIHPLKIGQ